MPLLQVDELPERRRNCTSLCTWYLGKRWDFYYILMLCGIPVFRHAYGNRVTHLTGAEMPRDWAPVSLYGATA